MSEVPGVYRAGNVLMVSFPRRSPSTYTPAPLYLPSMAIKRLTRSIRPDEHWPAAPLVAFSAGPSGS